MVSLNLDVLHTNFLLVSWFKVAVSAADSAGTVSETTQRRGADLGDTRKMLQIKLKNSEKITINVDINFYVSHV